MTPVNPGDRILELGGGDNPIPGVEVNVDIRPGPRTSFTADFDEPLPITSDEWDVVVSRFVIEHLSWRKVRQFVAEIFRILKPGGRAHVITADTEAQWRWIKDNPEGWDGKDFFDSASCILFGDQDYEDNTHKNFMSPEICTALFTAAGFESVLTSAFGERQTDLLVEAVKPASTPPAPITAGEVVALSKALSEANERRYAEHERRAGIDVANTAPAELYDKHYFNGGSKVGGYTHFGYMDFPQHNLTATHILSRKPKSVLELGCARGYVLKRILDTGIPGRGLEVSKHCCMTRVCEEVVEWDICRNAWPADRVYDLCYSVAVMEHIPEDRLPVVLNLMKMCSERGLHGIDFGEKDDGNDKTHVTLRSKAWWRAKFDEHGLQSHEVVDKEELEDGPVPPELLSGDGKVKLNVGSHFVMFHHGWQNFDILDLAPFCQNNGYQFRRVDVRQGLPYDTGSVHALYSSHMLEHLSYDEGLRFLRECRRVIRPDGVMRLLVPDAQLLLNRFADPRGFDEFDEINDECERAATPLGKLHALLLANHLAVYDEETLRDLLDRAGFACQRSSLHSMEGSFDDRVDLHQQVLRETHDMFPCLSLIVNAAPK